MSSQATNVSQQSITLEQGVIDSVRIVPVQKATVKAQTKTPIILLHEGLGSVTQWRDFPWKLANLIGCEVIVYSRYGYGHSDPAQVPRNVNFMHFEALQVLPALLDALNISKPILCGHSDGASISLLAAATTLPLTGVVTLAPHLFVEDITIKGIQDASSAYQQGCLRTSLEKHHNNVDHTFNSWCDIWLNPHFKHWNICQSIPHIQVPMLSIQGYQDQYGSMQQLQSLKELAPQTQLVLLDNCGHAPHLEQPVQTLNAITDFYTNICSAL